MNTTLERPASDALAAATNLDDAAEFASAWAADEFTKTTPSEASACGFDPIDDEPLIYTTESGTDGIWNPMDMRIEWSDEQGNGWILSPATGEVRRA